MPAAGAAMKSGGAPVRHAMLSLPDHRETRRLMWMRLLFLVGLLSWGSLAGWWATYFYRASMEVQQWTLRAYAAEQKVFATLIDQQQLDEAAARQALHLTVFAVQSLPLPEDARAFPFEQLQGKLSNEAVIVSEQERTRLHHQHARKMIMLAGEGSVLIGLLFVCLLVLYRMLMDELELRRLQESFVHSVTHELRSPLTGLRSLLQSFGSIEIPKQDRLAYIDLGLKEVERLDQLVSNILLSSRLEAAAFRPQVVDVDVGVALRRMEEIRGQVFRERGGDLLIEAPEGLAAHADPEALDLILRNLVDNALKYSKDKPTVRLKSMRSGKRVSIEVTDNGIGLSPADRARVFQKFYRAPSGEVQQAKGSGLGLFIARGLARSFGGDLTAGSDGPGRGSTFTVLLQPGGPLPR